MAYRPDRVHRPQHFAHRDLYEVRGGVRATPVGVAIDEAVETGKKCFGADGASSLHQRCLRRSCRRSQNGLQEGTSSGEQRRWR